MLGSADSADLRMRLTAKAKTCMPAFQVSDARSVTARTVTWFTAETRAFKMRAFPDAFLDAWSAGITALLGTVAVGTFVRTRKGTESATVGAVVGC